MSKITDYTLVTEAADDDVLLIDGLQGTRTITIGNLASQIGQVPGGGSAHKKQINFIDYDGTILYSFSKSEWQDVSLLPIKPSHDGLIAQAWNWSKVQIDAQLTAMPDGDIWVGMMYVTDDGKTRIYVHLEDGRLHPYLGICPNGTVIVDWGDNSETSTITGTSLSTVQYADHEYASEGDYVIALTVSRGSFSFIGVSTTSQILKKDTSTSTSIHRVYTNAIQKIELGNSVNIRSYAFNFCQSLKSITIPSTVTFTTPQSMFAYCNSLVSVTMPSSVTSINTNAFQYCYSCLNISLPSGVTSIGAGAFNNCYSLVGITMPSRVNGIGNTMFQNCYCLKSIAIPSNVTSITSNMFSFCHALERITMPDTITDISRNAFQYCHSLKSITIPSNVTSIGDYAFYTCHSLANITIPSNVTSIGDNAFYNCYGMAEYHFLSTTPPTLLSSNAFDNIQPDCKIYVPAESLTAYQEAAYWSNYASYMVGE